MRSWTRVSIESGAEARRRSVMLEISFCCSPSRTSRRSFTDSVSHSGTRSIPS